MGGMLSPSLLNSLGKNGYQICPSEATSSALDNIVVVTAAPFLRTCSRPFQSGVEDGFGKSAHSFPYGAILFQVDEMAYAIPHLSLALFDEHGSGYALECRACLHGYNFDVTGDESVVRGGGDDGVHIKTD